MATYLAHDALRLPAASLLANSGLCVNIEIKIWLRLGVNVDTAYKLLHSNFECAKQIGPRASLRRRCCQLYLRPNSLIRFDEGHE